MLAILMLHTLHILHVTIGGGGQHCPINSYSNISNISNSSTIPTNNTQDNNINQDSIFIESEIDSNAMDWHRDTKSCNIESCNDDKLDSINIESKIDFRHILKSYNSDSKSILESNSSNSNFISESSEVNSITDSKSISESSLSYSKEVLEYSSHTNTESATSVIASLSNAKAKLSINNINSTIDSNLDLKTINWQRDTESCNIESFNNDKLDSKNIDCFDFAKQNLAHDKDLKYQIDSKNTDSLIATTSHNDDKIDSKSKKSCAGIIHSHNENKTESHSLQNIDSIKCTQSPAPTQSGREFRNLTESSKKDSKPSILLEDSILFKPIDTLTQELFNTNSCKYLPKLYGIYKNVADINFNELPNSFVLKTNHDCGGVVLVPDKEAFLKDSKMFKESMDKLAKHLNTNFYTMYREWHYKDIEPRIFAEEMLVDGCRDPDTYKFHIFKNTDEHYVQLTMDRFTNYRRVILDKQWKLAPFGFHYDNANNTIPHQPKDLEMLKSLAFSLAEIFDYVRVDLYYMPQSQKQKIIVGELTFTHACGTEKLVPNSWDKTLGGMWQQTLFTLSKHNNQGYTHETK